MRIHKLAAAASVLLMSAGAAYASTYTIDESYTVTACTGTVCVTPPTVTTFGGTNGNAPSPNCNGLGLRTNISLPNGVQNFFTADPAGSAGNSSNVVKGTIQVDFTFTEKNSMGVTIGSGSLVQDGTFKLTTAARSPVVAAQANLTASIGTPSAQLSILINSVLLMVVRTAARASQTINLPLRL